MRTQEIVDDLVAARQDFYDVLARVEPSSLDAPGLVGEWGAREIIAHLGYWAGRAVDVMLAVAENRAEQLYDGQPSVDEVNATVARVARETDYATVRKREEAAVQALIDHLRTVGLAVLEGRLPSGAMVERLVLEDGPEHYRGHADELRRALGEGARA
jgi:hypothetical protein